MSSGGQAEAGARARAELCADRREAEGTQMDKETDAKKEESNP
jgi:hypothetical protein